jgi:HEAT repeat protein
MSGLPLARLCLPVLLSLLAGLAAPLSAEGAAPPDSKAAQARALLPSLKSKWAADRARAAGRLGELGPGAEEAAGELCLLLFDSDQAVRIQAARALGRIRAGGAVPFLLAALPSKKGELRRTIQSALSVIGKPAVGPLATALRDPQAEVREVAAQALGAIGSDAAGAVPGLVLTLQDRSALVRWSAAEALGKIGAPAGVKPLVAALKDRERVLSYQAALALGRIGKPAVPELRAALAHKSPLVRRHAALALGKVGPGAAPAIAPLVAALNDDDQVVRYESSQALARFGPRAFLPLLRALGHASPEARILAAETLVQMGAPARAAADDLRKVLRDKDRLARQAAAMALGRIGLD